MKRIALFLAMAVAAVACTPEQQITPEVNLVSDVSSLVIAQEGGNILVDFDANVEWTAAFKEPVDWATISPANGPAGPGMVKVIALKNETNDNRVATVVISAQSATKEFSVTQLQKDALVIGGEKSFDVPADGGQVKFSVNHNVELKITADADWLVQTKAMQTSEITFDVAPNEGAARTAKIVVEGAALKHELTVNQAAWTPRFGVSPTEDQWIAVGGGSVSIEVDANVPYEVLVETNDWLTVTNDGNTYTFTAAENPAYEYRSVPVSVIPEDEAFADSAVDFYVFQNGHASKLWTKNPAVDIDGYDATQKVRLAKYGDKILLANTTKVFVLDPATGAVESTIPMPEGVLAQNLLVDDAGNFLVAAEVIDEAEGELTLYYVADPMNPVLDTVFNYNVGNYYSKETGNIRVKGNIKDDAVITAVASDGAGGACLAWEVVDGVCSEHSWTSVPYTNWEIKSLCFYPLGNTMADGFYYIGYGGDYNLKYTESFVPAGQSTWATAFITGGTWMENWNCISTAEWNGKKYAAILASCHFDYDSADAFLLDINNPAAAELVYKYLGDLDVARDENFKNGNWTGGGTYSDILLLPTTDAIHMIYVDGNIGAMTCVAIQ